MGIGQPGEGAEVENCRSRPRSRRWQCWIRLQGGGFQRGGGCYAGGHGFILVSPADALGVRDSVAMLTKARPSPTVKAAGLSLTGSNFPLHSKNQAMSVLAPVSLGYRMPAEWEPHQATWLA